MEIIRYKNDKRFAVLFGVIPVLILYVILIIKAHSHPQFFEGLVIITFCYGFFILSITIGSFGLLDKKNNIFYKAKNYFYRKKIPVKDIQEIWYQSTWVANGLGKSLYVRGVCDGNFCVLDFPNVGFTEKVLARMARDLKEINPRIKLDEGAQKLLKIAELEAINHKL